MGNREVGFIVTEEYRHWINEGEKENKAKPDKSFC